MRTDAPSTAKQWEVFYRDVNRLTITAVAYWGAILVNAGVLVLLWSRGKADSPAYAFLVTVCTWVLAPGLAVPIMRHVPARWFVVPRGEHVLHRLLGVGAFGTLLERSGYNRRLVHPMWGFSINRAGLSRRAEAARGGASAHGGSFVVHLVLSALALVTGHASGALWILLPGVVLHLYPALLQRAILLRLQPLLHRQAST